MKNKTESTAQKVQKAAVVGTIVMLLAALCLISPGFRFLLQMVLGVAVFVLAVAACKALAAWWRDLYLHYCGGIDVQEAEQRRILSEILADTLAINSPLPIPLEALMAEFLLEKLIPVGKMNVPIYRFRLIKSTESTPDFERLELVKQLLSSRLNSIMKLYHNINFQEIVVLELHNRPGFLTIDLLLLGSCDSYEFLQTRRQQEVAAVTNSNACNDDIIL